MHSKEKEDNGECCQEEQERAHQLTYEQTFIVKTSSVKELVKQDDECYPSQTDET